MIIQLFKGRPLAGFGKLELLDELPGGIVKGFMVPGGFRAGSVWWVYMS